MSATSAQRGYAFEYIIIHTAKNILGVNITKDTKKWIIKKGENYYNKLESYEQDKVKVAANKLINFFLEEEDNISNYTSVRKTKEKTGGKDVTDIELFNGNNENSEKLRISAKVNHNAVRHQRVSPGIDIGQEWLGIEADKQYKDNIKTIFDDAIKYCSDNNIEKYRDLNKEKKYSLFYAPICKTVSNYLNRAYNNYNTEDLSYNLLTYMIGKKDFYKAIVEIDDDKLTIEPYNLRGNLNIGEKLIIPNQIKKIEATKSTVGTPNRVVIDFDDYWKIDMRLHNAEKRIMKSLKFDTRLVTTPVSQKVISLN